MVILIINHVLINNNVIIISSTSSSRAHIFWITCEYNANAQLLNSDHQWWWFPNIWKHDHVSRREVMLVCGLLDTCEETNEGEYYVGNRMKSHGFSSIVLNDGGGVKEVLFRKGDDTIGDLVVFTDARVSFWIWEDNLPTMFIVRQQEASRHPRHPMWHWSTRTKSKTWTVWGCNPPSLTGASHRSRTLT